jgi:hypothetical protein
MPGPPPWLDVVSALIGAAPYVGSRLFAPAEEAELADRCAK